MRIGDVMTRGVISTTAEATVQEAAEAMSAAGVGLLPVFDQGKLAGVITDRDMVVRALAQGLGPHARVRDAMTAQVVSCHEDQPLGDAGRLMEKHALRRLVVTDEFGELVGVISLDDLARVGEPQLAQELAHISNPVELVHE